jgi:hypothetical protein
MVARTFLFEPDFNSIPVRKVRLECLGTGRGRAFHIRHDTRDISIAPSLIVLCWSPG